MPPFWQYFSRLLKKRQTCPSRTPKGANHGPPSLFPCKRTASRGPRKGATMPIADPSARDLSAASRVVVVVGEGHAPVAAVLVPAVKKP